MYAPAPDGISLVFLCCAITAAAIIDSCWRRIPNPLTASIAITGFVHAAFAGGPYGALASLFGAGAGVMLLLGPYIKGLVGGGDVKYLGAVGAWVGALSAVRILVLGAAAGGVLAFVFMLRLKAGDRLRVLCSIVSFARFGELAVPSPEHLAGRERARGIPYGVALTLAALWELLAGARG
ncbi:prepilin peptidase [Pendulispora albinea]|uniref:A24 family peptidase n=1 Tax=Pendulispora albinea TaxID=2741071 RepID=A0ABZ2LMZ3_9BACT